MANSTSQIIIKLAVPSVFGLLSLALLKRIFNRKRREVGAFSPAIQNQLLEEEDSSLEGFASLENMRLKENVSDSCSDTCEISCSHLEKTQENIENTMANGVVRQNNINGQRKDRIINKVDVSNETSHSLKLKLRNAEEKQNPKLDKIFSQNGLKNGINVIPTAASCNHSNGTSQDTLNNTSDKIDSISQNSSNGNSHVTNDIKSKESNGFSSSASVHKTEETNGPSMPASTNCVSQDISVRPKQYNEVVKAFVNGATSTHRQEKTNVVTQASSSNGVSRPNKYKKKGKGKMHEKNNSCPTASISNGTDKTATLTEKDSKKELSDEFSALTVCDDAPSIQEPVQVETSAMDSSISITQNGVEQSHAFPPTESSSTLRTASAVPLSYSAVVKDCLLNDKQKNTANAKECDAIDLTNSVDNHCPTPESGRSSETLSDTTESLQIDVNDNCCVDLVASGGHSMLASPDAAYCDSLGSNDSGRGGSEIQFGYEPAPNSMVFQFELPTDKCGALIGKKGYYVNSIKAKTNASILITTIPFEKDKRIITVSGDDHEIQAALQLIRHKFPLNHHPEVTLEPRSIPEIFCPPSLKLALPDDVTFQVVLSATITAGHFFVQLPTHPSFHALLPFTMSMTSMYTNCHTPAVSTLSPGNIVAAAACDNGWYRAEVVEIYPEQDTCKVKYLDYGGYQVLPKQALRQIHMDMMHMPFQATECYLAGVTCHEELGWTEESKMAFENLAQGQVLSAYVAGISEDGVPCLYLYHVSGATNTFINQALVEAGYLKWVTNDDQ